jgi:hypothetical protein
VAQTPNLLITHLAAAQAKKEITVNEAMDALDQATQGHAVVDVSTVASVVVGLDTYLNNFCLRVAGSTGAAVVVTLPPSNRFFALDNGSDGTITAGIAGGTGSVVLTPGQIKAMVAQDTRLTELTAGTAPPFSAMLYVAGAPTAGEVVARLAMPYGVSFASAFAGSVARTVTAATASAAFNVTKNGSGIGSISFAAASTAGTFAGAAGSFVLGDVLGVTAPASADATLADVSITLLGTRS